MFGTLFVPVDLIFPMAGIVIMAYAFRQRISQGEEEIPSFSLAETALTVIALLCTAIGPNILLVALTPGMVEMHLLARYLLIPSLIVLMAIGLICRRRSYRRLGNRLWTGIWVGAAATAALDVVRLAGFSLGLMPGNMPRMFGVLILNIMATGPTVASDIIGYLYHYWVGACFGLTLTLLFGKVRWWAGLVWAILIELGMMVTPPMVVAMDTGYFGSKFGPGLFAVSLIAHVVYGVLLGLLIERYTAHRGSFFQLICAALPKKRSAL